MEPYTPTTYDHFACSLAKSLCYIKAPVTVGLFARWGSGIKLVLQKLKERLNIESALIEEKMKSHDPRPRSDGTLLGLLQVIFRLLFYDPVVVTKYRNVRFITVNYSAWDYAGSDKLWAGIVTTLCEGVHKNFHPLTIGTHRAISRDVIPKPADEAHKGEWKAKRVLCVIPLWLYSAFLLPLSLLVAILALIMGFPTQYGVMVVSLESIGISVASVSGIVTLKKLFPIVYNLIVPQKEFIEKLLNKTDFSAQLGFMKKVKEEIQTITNFVHFMEVFERRRIRIVLEITDLDRCGSEKIIRVLEAMRTLLSDEEARFFISILAMDSNVIERAMGDCIANKGTTDKNGYELLNHIVDLPLCVPTIDGKTKLQILQKLIHREKENIEIYQYMSHEQVTVDTSEMIMNPILHTSDHPVKQVQKDMAVKVAAWVVLASQWPCRLSWIIHWTEPSPQRTGDISPPAHYTGSTTLWEVYQQSQNEFCPIMKKMETLLTLDGDPKVFKSFLKKHYVFIVDDISRFYPATINLDPAFKEKLKVAWGHYNFEKCQTEMMVPKGLQGISKS
uniref:NTPase KAP family P-loop domain-containing protein 1-like n=1 Tax=Myxine glutinosa TaxID=7769 RepID=UPI00358F4F09